MAASAAPATQTTTAPPDSGAGGLPQFDTAKWPGQAVWILIIFAVTYALFSRVVLPRVGGAIADREDRIAGDIGDARRMRDRAETQAAEAAEETAKARARAHAVGQDAKSKAQAEAAARDAQEQAKLAETLGRAEARIAAARDEAMSHVESIAAETAVAIVEKLTGKAPSASELKAWSRG